MTTETEETVSDDALLASLEQLVKAAGATETVNKLKKGGIVYSGHEDERGHVGGGGASASDAGGLEQMMIGKLVANGLSQEMAAKAVADMFGLATAAGMLGKQDDMEEGEEDEEEGEEEMSAYARGYMDAQKKFGKSMRGGEEDTGEETLRKSHAEQFTDDSDIANGVDASPFLEALTARTTASLDQLNKSMQLGHKRQDKVNAAMAGAMYQMGSLVKSQQRVIKSLGERLGLVERQPAAPAKGATSVPAAKALSKSFDGGGGGGAEPLSKSEAAAVLSYLRFEKSMDTIEGERTSQLAVMAESGGTLSKSVHDYIHKWVATHPNERQQAVSYR